MPCPPSARPWPPPWIGTVLIPLLLALGAGPARSQALRLGEPPIKAASVAAVLGELRSRDGNGTVVTQADGWVHVQDPAAAAQWSFTPPGHAAHPSAVRRTIRRGPGGAVAVQVAGLCEAPEAACSQLLAEFNAMNERIVQALRARGRMGSTAPPQ